MVQEGIEGMERNYALEYRVRKQREDQSREIIRELEERERAKANPSNTPSD
jgi:hypothetical protein